MRRRYLLSASSPAGRSGIGTAAVSVASPASSAGYVSLDQSRMSTSTAVVSDESCCDSSTASYNSPSRRGRVRRRDDHDDDNDDSRYREDPISDSAYGGRYAANYDAGPETPIYRTPPRRVRREEPGFEEQFLLSPSDFLSASADEATEAEEDAETEPEIITLPETMTLDYVDECKEDSDSESDTRSIVILSVLPPGEADRRRRLFMAPF